MGQEERESYQDRLRERFFMKLKEILIKAVVVSRGT